MATTIDRLKSARLFTIPAGTRASRCRGVLLGGVCEKICYWVDDEHGARRIVDADVPNGKRPSESKDTGQFDLLSGGVAEVFDGAGIDHHFTCPDVELFKKGGAR